jgi:hypothetical protein
LSTEQHDDPKTPGCSSNKGQSGGRARNGPRVLIFRLLARLLQAPNPLYLGPNPVDVEVMHRLRRVDVDLSDEHLLEVLEEWVAQ